MNKRKNDNFDGQLFTKIKKINLNYEWQIVDFDKMLESKSIIKSESFIIKNVPDLSWYFTLNQFTVGNPGTSPAGMKKFISVYLNCIDSSQALIKLSLKFSIVNSDGSTGYNLSLTNDLPRESQSYGFEKFISHETLNSLRRLYPPSNDLNFFVEIDLTTYVNILRNPVYACKREKRYKVSNSVITNSNFEVLFENSDFSDLTIICENERIPVHKAVLAAKSKSFYKKLKTMKSNEFKLKIALPVLYELLSFMYKGKCPNLQNYIDELFDAAVHCHMPDLKCLIEQTLMDSINLENSVDRLIWAEIHEAQNLKDCAIYFIKQNIQDIIKTKEFDSIIHEHPKLTKELFCGIVEHFPKNEVDRTLGLRM